jgi:ribosomal protein S18 acetylase RimI-like enzyme
MRDDKDTEALEFRHPSPEDYLPIIEAIETWWTVPLLRPANGLVQRLFLEHFADTSFSVRDHTGIAAFLIGFLSQSENDQAYIHFVGVAPHRRRRGVGRALYERFFQVVRSQGRTRVRCITSPRNHESVEFHRQLGFQLLEGGGSERGIPVHPNHGGRGIAMVVFEKDISQPIGMHRPG